MLSATAKKRSALCLGLVALLALLAGLFGFYGSADEANPVGLGDIRYTWERSIYEDVTLSHVMSYNNNKDQKTYTVSFDPRTAALKPVLAYGGNVMSGSTMSSLVAREEEAGRHVVFGINGDAYDTSNGVSNGIMINEARLITSSNAAYGFGFKADGSVVYGSAALQMQASVGETVLSLQAVNKERKMDTEGVYFLTEDFDDVTNSTEAGVEVLLNVSADQLEEGLRIGTPLSLTVEQVVTVERNPDRNQTPIGAGKAVLAAHRDSSRYDFLASLTPGTAVTVSVEDVSDDRIDWAEVETGMGIFHLLLDNGVVPEGVLSDTAVHPRTSMGIKADGSVVLMQNDGRQVGWANGLSFQQMIEYMRDELGCVTIFNFDGGGSSTISVTLPGDERASVLNRPSDGHERANTNALLFVATEEPVEGSPVEQLHLYPETDAGYAPKAMVLEGGKLTLDVKATDSRYYAASLEGQTVEFSVESDDASIGNVDENGVFTANKGAGTGRVIAKVGEVTQTFEIEVVDSITLIETDLTILSIAPGKTQKMDFRAYKDGVPVMCSPESLTFALDPQTLGSVAADGTFTATEGQGTGNLVVSYKDYSLTIPVEVGKMPVLINDFEVDFEDESNTWNRYYTNIPQNGGWGQISINRDERYIKSGDGSLRIDYDFATNPLTGTVAIEIGESGYTTLEGQPTAIGCWVYGDGNGGWFRIQLVGGVYAGDTYIDWVGWKYIETPIPTNAPFPYKIQRAVRLLGTASVCNNKKGTIYVDSLRAIYDFKNDDVDAPVLVENSVSPAEGGLTADRQQEIRLRVQDARVGENPYTGIATDRTQMFINNKQVENLQQTVNADGSVDIIYHPGALDQLRPGKQNVRVRVEDNFGNKSFFEWSFTVEGYAVQLIEHAPETDVIYAGQTFTYGITPENYKNFTQYDLQLAYNSQSLELVGDPAVDERLHVTAMNVDREAGLIELVVIGMNAQTTPETDMISFTFRARDEVSGTAGIEVLRSEVTESDVIGVTDLILNGYDGRLDYKYVLSNKGVTHGSVSELTVRTADGQPVSGMGFTVTRNGEPYAFDGLTDENGMLSTAEFLSAEVGTVYRITAVSEGLTSNCLELTVLDSLGSVDPQKIVLTVGQDASTMVGVSWETSFAAAEGKVRYALDEAMTNPVWVDATASTVVTVLDNLDREYRAWGAYLTGLQPDTLYYYQVGSEAGWSQVYSFRTAPADEATIAFYGDIQGGPASFPATVEALTARFGEVDLSLLAGDVADNAQMYSEWTAIDQNLAPYLRTGMWAATVGNHDAYYEGQAFSTFFYGPDNGTDGSRRNYWFEIGDILFFNFDTEAGYGSYDPGYTAQKELMKQVMADTDKTFKVVLMHRSAYPMRYDEPEIRALAPFFEECGVDLVLSGHDHIYNRTTMLNGEKTAGGVTYVVGGSASGSKYYEADPNGRPWADVVYDDNNPVFSLLRQTENELIFEAYALIGGEATLIDSFTVGKQVEAEISAEHAAVTSGPLRFGRETVFTVIPESGYLIQSVTVNGSPVELTENTFTVIPEGDLSIEVLVEQQTFTVTFNQPEGGTLTGDASAVYGESKTFTATPDPGWKLTSVKVNGEQVEVTDGSFTVENITDDLFIEAAFEREVYTVDITCNHAEISGERTAGYGESLTFTLNNISEGYRLVSVKVNGETVELSEDNTFTVENITGDVSVIVEFSQRGTCAGGLEGSALGLGLLCLIAAAALKKVRAR